MNFIRDCKFNMAPLTPLYFPLYPKDRPLSYANYPFAFQMFNVQVGGFTVIKGSRQISKSTTFCIRQTLLCRLFTGFSSLYICPRRQYLNTYANRLREVERSYIHYEESSKFRQNLYFKEYPNRSRMELIYVLSTAANARSKTADEILWDEVQDMDPDLELEIAQVQSSSETPISVFAGTSLTTETMLEAKWELSSQGYWVMRCSSCKTFNVPTPDGGVMDMIQPEGPCCKKCRTPLNILAGEWVHAYPDRLGEKNGFHIPQLIVPAVVLNKLRWKEIYAKKSGDQRKFFQEILGIATEEGARELTREHLQSICVLGDKSKVEKFAQAKRYKYVVSGCDWGGSDYLPAQGLKLSTTVHIMIGLTTAGKMEIIHFARYTGMGYDEIASQIIYDHNKFKGDAMASDFGVGAVYNSKLRQALPWSRHLIFNFTGPDQPLIAEPTGPHMYNQWSLNKTESLSMTFQDIRNQDIKCYSWDQSREYLLDCMNIFRAPSESLSSGRNGFVYRASPSKPNDALMAMTFANMLGRVMLRKPMYADESMIMQLEGTLHAPITLNSGIPGMQPGYGAGPYSG